MKLDVDLEFHVPCSIVSGWELPKRRAAVACMAAGVLMTCETSAPYRTHSITSRCHSFSTVII